MSASRQIGSMTGKVTSLRIFKTSNGEKVYLTLANEINTKDAQGNIAKKTEFIEFEDFYFDDKPKNVYNYLHNGDRIQVGFVLRQNVYVDKNTNKTQYRQYAKVTTIDLLETKGATEGRTLAAIRK